MMMMAEQDGAIKKAVGILKELSSDERERLLDEAHQKFMWDWTSSMDGAFEDGVAKGIIETARKLRSMGLSVEQIAEGTGLLPEDIERL